MIRSALRLARPVANLQTTRDMSMVASIKSRMSTIKVSDFSRFLPELGPPTPAEIPRAIKDLVRLFKSKNWQNVTVREAWLNTLVTTEVICWFFVGECIGKATLIGYQV